MIEAPVVDKKFVAKMYKAFVPPKGVGLLESCRDDVVLFSKFMLGVELRAWQIFFVKKLGCHFVNLSMRTNSTDFNSSLDSLNACNVALCG